MTALRFPLIAFITAAFFTLQIGVQVMAAATTQPTAWTIHEAVQYALANNPDAKAVQRRIESAQADIKNARAAFYPQISLHGEYARTNNPMYSFGNILNQGVFSNSIDFNNPGLTDNLQLKALLLYRFYNGGRDKAGLTMADSHKKARELQHTAIRSALGFEVVRAFFTIVQAEETVQARESALNALSASLGTAQARYEEGDLLKEEVLNLEVQQALARENLIQARHGLALTQRGFMNLLGLQDDNVVIDQAGSAHQNKPDNIRFENRPEIKSMLSAIKALEAGVEKAASGYLPTADAYGSYQVDQGYELDDASGNSWLAGVRVNFTLFNGMKTAAEVEKAQAQLAEAREQLRKLKLDYDLEIEQATLMLEQAEKRIQVTGKMVESAAESARLSRARFKEGLILSSELIDTENRLTDAEVRHALANAEQRIAIADLRRASGEMQFGTSLSPTE